MSSEPSIQVFPVARWFDEEKHRWLKKPKVRDPLNYSPANGELKHEANFGVFPPDGLVFFDLDLYKGVTREQVNEALGAELDWENAKLQDTISGGEHFAFSIPSGIPMPNRDSVLGVKGFDIRAAGRGWLCMGRGYEDHTLIGLPNAITLMDWPELSESVVEKLRVHGKVIADQDEEDDEVTFNDKLPTNPDTLERLIDRIPNADADYARFFDVGAALHYETLGSREGYDLWVKWAKKCEIDGVFDESEMPTKWRSLGKSDNPNVVTIGSLRYFVKQAGLSDKLQGIMPEDLASDVAFRISAGLKKILWDEKLVPWIDQEAITQVIESCFWSGARAKLFLLGPAGSLIQSGKEDIGMFLSYRFNPIVDYKVLASLANDLCPEDEEGKKSEKMLKRLRQAVFNPLFNCLKVYNQRELVTYRTDLWAKTPRVDIGPEEAIVITNYSPLPDCGVKDDAIIEDYKKHFPRLDEFLELLVWSKVARDRKQSYLWILAESDWGKGFLSDVFKELGLVVEMSTKEAESLFEGKPVGKSPSDFKHNMILLIDEFKSAKSEIKQLQSTITISPKFQLSAQVEIFTKLFTSAENVDSLVGDAGLEDQFANRFSVFTEHGVISDRPLFQEVGSVRYFDALLNYTSRKLNELLEDKIYQDKTEVQTEASHWLKAFNLRNNLDQLGPRLSEALPEVAEFFYHWLDSNFLNQRLKLVKRDDGAWFLTHAAKVVNDFLQENYSHSELNMLRRKKKELYVCISEDDRGYASHAVHKGIQARTKSIKLRNSGAWMDEE